MIVRSIWSDVSIPEHQTSDEVITVPNDSTTIQELFERAARGESLGGSYDEFDDDSIFDDVHDPDLQDPLLRESMRLNTLEDVKDRERNLVQSIKKAKNKDRKSSKDSSTSEDGGQDNSVSNNKEAIRDKS